MRGGRRYRPGARRLRGGLPRRWAWSRAWSSSPGWPSCAPPSARRPPGDRLLVNWDEGYVTLVLARGRVAGARADAVAGPRPPRRPRWRARWRSTVLYYRERLGGRGPRGQVVVRSAAAAARRGRRRCCEGRWASTPEVLDPWAALRAADAGRERAQALAGAAACLGAPAVRPLNLASRPFRNERLPAAAVRAWPPWRPGRLTVWHALVLRGRCCPAARRRCHREVAALEAEAAQAPRGGPGPRCRRARPAATLAQWTWSRTWWTGARSPGPACSRASRRCSPTACGCVSVAPDVRKGQVELDVTPSCRSPRRAGSSCASSRSGGEFYGRLSRRARGDDGEFQLHDALPAAGAATGPCRAGSRPAAPPRRGPPSEEPPTVTARERPRAAGVTPGPPGRSSAVLNVAVYFAYTLPRAPAGAERRRPRGDPARGGRSSERQRVERAAASGRETIAGQHGGRRRASTQSARRRKASLLPIQDGDRRASPASWACARQPLVRRRAP